MISGDRVSSRRSKEVQPGAEADGAYIFGGLTSTFPPRQRPSGRAGHRDVGGRPHRAHHGIANSNLRCHMLFWTTGRRATLPARPARAASRLPDAHSARRARRSVRLRSLYRSINANVDRRWTKTKSTIPVLTLQRTEMRKDAGILR